MNADKTLKKATKGTGYVGNHITVADLKAEPYGLLPKPVMVFCTKQEIYKTLSMEQKAPLNAFKSYINEHPTCIAWHNGKVDDACKINGFHLHAVIMCENELCKDNGWRTLRSKLEQYGMVIRTKKVRNLRGLLAHFNEKPRLIGGCNNIFLAKFAKEGIDRHMKLEESLLEDEKMPPLLKEADEVNEFLSHMLGWEDTVNVSPPRNKDPSYMTINDIFFSDTPIESPRHVPQPPRRSTFNDIVEDKPAPSKSLPATKTSEKVGVLKELCKRYNCFDQGQLLTTLMAESDEDVKQWRILRTSPNFNVIWSTCMEELKSEKIVANKTYGEIFVDTIQKKEETGMTMTVSETAQFWSEWCRFQNIDKTHY